ncbi:MAG: iron-sulfur cluster assembly scaffold protein [Syntrophobacteraceae bacterium]|nr:iron-sulfur cluster assembly scaffold protein [Syntrophobacteraceae bacterium]
MEINALAFWEKHSVHFLEMVFKSDRRESLRQPDGYGRKSRECGDTIEIYLMLRDGIIDSASFETNGCIYSVACANTTVHLAMGKSLPEARDITASHIIRYLETLPEHERHCAELAAEALQLAVTDAQQTSRQPWRRLYRSF